MATVEIVTLTDSLDERIKTGVETVTFFHPVFGTKYEIELSEKNREHFAAHLAKLDKYIDASREVKVAEPTKPVAKSDGRISAIRSWAQANGYVVGDRGRIKAEIVEAYDKAQTPTAVAEQPAESKPEAVAEQPAESKPEAVVEQKDTSEDTQAKADLTEALNAEPSETELVDNADPTATMTPDEFADFILNNMGEDGTVSAEALAKDVDSE